MTCVVTGSLLELCADVLNCILSKWTMIHDLCLLDSAFCKHSERSTFLDLVSNHDFVHTNGVDDFDWSGIFLDWLILRKLRVGRISLKDRDDYSSKLDSYLDSLSGLDCLLASCSDSLIKFLTRFNS